MNTPTMKATAFLAARMGHLFVATVGADGAPHLAAAAKVSLAGELVEVGACFCPVTMANLRENRSISLVAWNPDNDQGYQLLGQAERVEELAEMDGSPPVGRKLLVRVERILDFHRGPHSDRERS